MLAILTDVIAEADGSEEFRKILWVLIQERQEGVQEKQEGACFSAVQSGAKQTRNAWTGSSAYCSCRDSLCWSLTVLRD